MTNKEKLEKIKAQADKMCKSAEYLKSDASHLHKAIYEYRQFISQHWNEEEPVSEDIYKTNNKIMKGLVEAAENLIPKSDDSYDGYMDKECVAICNALNNLPDVETVESCCGHCKEPYRIWFKTKNLYSLGVIARVFDRRYSGTNIAYNIRIKTNDTGESPMYTYVIESISAYDNDKDMNEDIETIVDNIHYWQSARYYNYFANGESTKEEPANEDLEEAAEKQSDCYYLCEVLSRDDYEVLQERLKNTFKAGAQWQKEHIIDKDCWV